ncbi:MAG: GNAT family N-acetyltransferase [Gammaproteobacteria bacterium]|nr:GNAT family N-acetyltransferase [Gammaproteobacteria bacterium]
MIVTRLVDKISEEVETKMRTDLIKYEHNNGIDVNYRCFSLVLIDDDNNTIGVLNAFTAFAEIYIDDIWVDSTKRDRGFGRKLLEDLENNFKGKGFN